MEWCECGFPWMEETNKSHIFSKSAQIFTTQSFNSAKEGYKAIKSVEMYLQFYLHLV